MVDTTRQVPAPCSTAWAFDLRDARGPLFLVLRRAEPDARETLVEHLAQFEALGSAADARELVDRANAGDVVVIW